LDFEKQKQAESLWDKQLAKIDITESNQDKTIFIPHCIIPWYSPILHRIILTNRGRDNKVHEGEGFDYYSVFSLWDNFRAAHPLYTLIEKNEQLILLIHSKTIRTRR
jgi:putative alpha-1,2-mannosidase